MSADYRDHDGSPKGARAPAEKDLSRVPSSPVKAPGMNVKAQTVQACDAQAGRPLVQPKPIPRHETSPLTSDELDALRSIVRAYKDHKIDFTVLPRRPRFKNPRVNSGITCNEEIRRRALGKAKTDPDGTGGSLSSLIELLLWKYLGCPSDVVEHFPGLPATRQSVPDDSV